MEFSKKHAGKWVAVKNQKVIAMNVSFAELRKQLKKMPKKANISFDLVPNGHIAGPLIV